MIEIQDLQRKSHSEIIDLLLEQRSDSFNIYIPRATQLFSSDKQSIAIDYNKLAYAGHLLLGVSSEFRFTKVTPDAHESVLFDVKSNNIEALATVLLEISFGYVNDCEEESHRSVDVNCEFDMNAEQYLSDVLEGKTEPACPYFCEVASQYFKEIAEEE